MVTTCSICGTTEAVDPGKFSKCLLRDILRDIMEERKCCFYCAFWINHLGLYKNDPNRLVINGASWMVHPYVPASERKSSFIGCGGREMKAITEDGREFFSNNWGHQGDILERFLKLIDKFHFAKWVR